MSIQGTVALSLRWVIAAGLLSLAGCATTARDLPSCSNVRGYFAPDVPVGGERVGSRIWLERKIIYSPEVGRLVLRVAAGQADGDWQAGQLDAPILVERGLWKTSVAVGLYVYDVNFNARAWPEPDLTTARLERRTVDIYLHVFGPSFGADGLERTIPMAALRYRNRSNAQWAICPVRL
jgi:hypothetical protein